MIFRIKKGVWNALSEFAKMNMNFIQGDKLNLFWKEEKTVKGKKVLVDMEETVYVPKKYYEKPKQEKGCAVDG